MKPNFLNTTTTAAKTLALAALCLSLTACVGMQSASIKTVTRQSSLTSYLSSGNTTLSVPQKKPLTLPITVGVAFVPSQNSTQDLPETTKKKIIDAVCAQLTTHKKYVSNAFPIPTSYLRPQGGISALVPVAKEFDADVVILLATNQSQKQQRNPVAALLDITVIGQYLIPGTSIDTNTVLEAAVLHVPSQALIFRADGADEMKSAASRYGATATAQNDGVTSIENASKKLVVSIAESLIKFEKFDTSKIEEMRLNSSTSTDDAERQNRQHQLLSPPPAKDDYWKRVGEYKRSGGGAFGGVWLALIGVTAVCAARRRQ